MLTLVLISTLGAWIGFANPLFHFPLAALAFPMGLAWIGFRATSGKKAFKFGWMAGVLAATGCYYWMVIPVQVYGGLPWYIALPCPFLLASFMSLYFAFFSLGMYHAGQKLTGIPLCLLAGLAWATMEMLMGIVLTGFPWVNLSSAFASWPVAIQGASVIGAYGLSGVMTTLAVALLLYSTYRSALWLAVGITITLISFGFYRVNTLEKGNGDYVLSAIQGNVDQGEKWIPAYQADTIKKYAHLTLQAIRQNKPRAVIWPETAMPFYLQDRTQYRKAVETLAQEADINIITGSPAYKVTNMKSSSYVLFNRVWLMDTLGRTTQYYDKEHLVPFGEYMPFAEWLPFDKLVTAAGNFVPGEDNKPLMLDGVALGMLICYEAIFPELAQKQVANGANILINISNDAWFGDTSAPRQHLNLSIMRAVEQDRWLVRSTNTGISAFVAPTGRIAAMGTQFKAESLSHAVEPRTGFTVFHRIHYWLEYCIFTLTIVGFGYILFVARRQKGTII
ncbi:apolipoprotein N-acyltransferase [Pseudodesulfovibrio sediminis]|uniref:Apolipoprotein N-acyltransferase n=1 Tax=Pseudodesulfovibrio sediminis TaxID=2810563 RepID=A0ABM7P306_9BACT|nr:apolipoprotein N-acyltransferase [Pseudodesulfovibrio sediminis]BCS87235.1 apolipoprotein N-acyltransferase [Pseudodesulfovibrio sediminis]